MNVGRLVAAAVAATVWDAIYGFCVYGVLLAPEFAKYPNVYLSADALAKKDKDKAIKKIILALIVAGRADVGATRDKELKSRPRFSVSCGPVTRSAALPT